MSHNKVYPKGVNSYSMSRVVTKVTETMEMLAEQLPDTDTWDDFQMHKDPFGESKKLLEAIKAGCEVLKIVESIKTEPNAAGGGTASGIQLKFK